MNKCACEPNFKAFGYHMPWCEVATWLRDHPDESPDEETKIAAIKQLQSCVDRFSTARCEGIDSALYLVSKEFLKP